MDDQQFDDIVRKKLSEYEGPGFDPSALSALHRQLDSVQPWPWYSRYRTELFTVLGMALCTLIIVGTQWYLKENEIDRLKDHANKVNAQQEQIKNLLVEIKVLKNQPPDTVSFVEYAENPTSINYSLMLVERIRNLEAELSKMQQYLDAYPSDADRLLTHYPEDTLYGPSNETKHGNSYFRSSRLVPKQDKRKSAVAKNKIQNHSSSIERNLSPKTLRDLQKHYHKGIGIRIGPTLEASHGFYDGGNSTIDFGAGALGDFILSPSISVEIGAKFSHRFYEISGDLSSKPLPDVDYSLGPLVTAEVDSWLLETPVNFKYRYPLTVKSNWIGGIGYSTRIYTSQIFEYNYTVDGNPDAQLTTSTSNKKIKMYPGAVNIFLGLSRQLKNNKTWETSLFYQHGLGEAGAEKMKANFLGIRGTYWFTVK